jgi:hypothetical protein
LPEQVLPEYKLKMIVPVALAVFVPVSVAVSVTDPPAVIVRGGTIEVVIVVGVLVTVTCLQRLVEGRLLESPL